MESGGNAPLTFQKGVNRGNGAFWISLSHKFMVHQDRIETNLLQLFVHPENLECFSIISVIIFDVNIVAEQKQGCW